MLLAELTFKVSHAADGQQRFRGRRTAAAQRSSVAFQLLSAPIKQ